MNSFAHYYKEGKELLAFDERYFVEIKTIKNVNNFVSLDVLY